MEKHREGGQREGASRWSTGEAGVNGGGEMNPPVRGLYIDGGTEAEIRDDGYRITLTVTPCCNEHRAANALLPRTNSP